VAVVKLTPRRGGTVDIVLVIGVVLAAWIRTPVGGLFDRGVAWARGSDVELAPLTSYFVTGPAPEVVVVLAERAAAGELPELPPAPATGFPEPYRTAARLTLDDDALPTLDTLWDGDPESTLEAFAIGAELRDRAVERAKSAGEREPRRFGSHRAWLPDREARHADDVVSGTLALSTVLSFTWPLAVPHRVSSPYGDRFHPVLKRNKFHDGVDLAVPVGSPVLAAQAGTVAKASSDDVSGNFVIIDHGHGVRTSYCHLSALGVAKGDTVVPGQQIGLSGNTGRSTGPHLHFTVRVGRGTVDPLRLRPVADRPAIDETGPGEAS
jgi:murein DD-endopeptidase